MKYLQLVKEDKPIKKQEHRVAWFNLNENHATLIEREDEKMNIATSESNPALCRIAYAQGWSDDPNNFTLEDALKVTNVGDAFGEGDNGYGYGSGYDYGYGSGYDYGYGSGYDYGYGSGYDYGYGSGYDYGYGSGYDYGYGSGYDYGYGSGYSSPRAIESDDKLVHFDEFKYFKNLKTIGNHAFSKNMALKSITCPKSVEKIGYDAFGNSGIQEVTFLSPEPPVYDDVDDDLTYVSKIKVPKTSLRKYQKAWGSHITKIEGIKA